MTNKLLSLETRRDFKPVKLEFEPSKAAVVVVAVQNDLFSPGGEIDIMVQQRSDFYSMEQQRAVIKPIQNILQASRSIGCRVVYSKFGYRPDKLDSTKVYLERHAAEGASTGMETPHGGKMHIKGTWSTDIIDELKPDEKDVVVESPSFNKFYSSSLDHILRNLGVEILLFTGVANDILPTFLYGADMGYVCIWVSDAITTTGYFGKVKSGIEDVLEHAWGLKTSTEKILKAFS